VSGLEVVVEQAGLDLEVHSVEVSAQGCCSGSDLSNAVCDRDARVLVAGLTSLSVL
jgi:hypothetical protein